MCSSLEHDRSCSSLPRKFIYLFAESWGPCSNYQHSNYYQAFHASDRSSMTRDRCPCQIRWKYPTLPSDLSIKWWNRFYSKREREKRWVLRVGELWRWVRVELVNGGRFGERGRVGHKGRSLVRRGRRGRRWRWRRRGKRVILLLMMMMMLMLYLLLLLLLLYLLL